MQWIIKKLVKFFFNRYYRIKPPESVNYWKTGEPARARLTHGEAGNIQMEIKGEKYPFEGFPRAHVLVGPLAKLKQQIKDSVFNQVFAQIESLVNDMQYDMLPPERMCPAMQELHKVLQELEDAEVTEDMKARIRLIKKVLTFFLQEDDAYRYRFQWVIERIDKNKVKLSKSDKYYFRGKYFKVDHDKFDY